MMIDTNIDDQNEQVAPGQVDDDNFRQEMTTNIKRGRAHWTKWRQEARIDYDFFAGVQWDETDSEKLQSEGRPAVVFNRIVRIINSVAGLEIQNRQAVKYYPRKIDQPNQQPPGTTDAGYADMMNQASSWVRDQNDAEDEESDSFNDNLICGCAFTETRMDYEVDPEGMIVKDRIDPLEVLVDPESSKKNFADAKWIAHIKDYYPKEVAQMFPGYVPAEGGGVFWNEDQDGMVHDAQDAWMYKNDQSDHLTTPGKVAVIRYQYYKTEKYYKVLTLDNKIVEIPASRYSKAKAIIDQQSQQVVGGFKKRIYKQCFMVGTQIFDHEPIKCNEFTIQGMTGLRDRNRRQWFGLVRLMRDPQRWANKWLSQIQYILNTSSKNALMVETGAVVNRRGLEDDLAQPGAIIDLNPGGLQKIDEFKRADFPDGFDRLLNYAMQAINDVPGVNLELIGMADRDQPIGLESQRKQAGITVLATFFDSLRRYRKTDGRLLAYFIREYIANGRLIRILGQNGIQYVPLIKDSVAFQYDIIVDDSPTSPNSKERTFLIMNQVAPMLMQAGIPMPPEILDYMPLPEDFIQKWKQTIAESNQPDPYQDQIKQIQMLMMQLEAEQKQADIQKTGSETVKNFAQAEKDKAVGQEQSALAAQKFGVAQGDQTLKAINMKSDQNRKNVELYLNHFRKMLEMQLENKLKRDNMGAAPSLNQIH